MKLSDYDKQLLKWVRNHYWDSLEKDKELILLHLRTFAGDERASQPIAPADGVSDSECPYCYRKHDLRVLCPEYDRR